MNHYSQALAELQLQPDHELKQIGDQWQTPTPLAWGLFHHFAPTLGPVVLDMFADDCNHLLPNYYTAADNALTQELAADLRRIGGAAFGNPPYSRPCVDGDGHPITGMEAILHFCREQRALGAKIMLLIKAATSETWWPEDADFIQFISGRIGFEAPNWYVPRDPKKDKPSASGFASAVVIFDAGRQGERRPEARLRRDDLITTGQIILDMIHRQAVTLIEEAEYSLAKTRQGHVPDAGKMVEPNHIGDTNNMVAQTALEPAMMQEQPAVAEPAAWEPPVASDEATNAAAASELAMLEQTIPTSASTKLAELGYADASSIMAKQIGRVYLGEEQQDTVRGYVQGWLDEPYPLSEIFYRLELAAANLLAGQPIHQGFVMEDNRAPTLPRWQRHPAVKAIIYQIDDADILTPAKTAELAAWIIDNLTAPGDLLTLATAKAAELLAQSAEPTSPEPDHAEQQLDMVDVPGQEPDAHQVAEEFSTKPLEDWAFDYQNDQLNLGGADWSRFVIVLTLLYGIRDRYTPRQVAITISICDEALMEEYTTLPKAEKTRLRDVVAAFTGALRKLAGCPDDVIQHAVIAFDQQRNKYPRGEYIRRASMQLSQTAIDQHGRIAAAQDEDSA